MSIVNDESVLSLLQQYNPWWRDAAAIKARSKPQRRLAFWETLKIVENKDIRRFVVLSGMRRVGKTTLLYQMIDALLEQGVPPQNILYVTFDTPLLKLVRVDEVLAAYDALYPAAEEKYLFFDEIQYAEDWERWLKVIYDSRSDVHLVATGSASPLLEKGSADSGTGRWRVIKVPSLSFYEYCQLLGLEQPDLSDVPPLSQMASLPKAELMVLTNRFTPLLSAFNRYLMVGGFPELALAQDDFYAQQVLQEDVVDKVIKRDVLTLFNIRSPLTLEKLFVYLCIHSTQLFNAATAAREIGNVSVVTLENYLEALEMSNLIYVANPVQVGGKAALKGKPKIFVADAAIRNAVLQIDDVLSDETALGATVETMVYKHLSSFYQGSRAQLGYYRRSGGNQKEVDAVVVLPRGEKILCEVKYRGQSQLPQSDEIVALCQDPEANVANAFLITKRLEDVGVTQHATVVPILRMPALPFLYLLGSEEAAGRRGRL